MMILLDGRGERAEDRRKGMNQKKNTLFRDIEAHKVMVFGNRRKGKKKLRCIYPLPYISNLMTKVLLLPTLHKEIETQKD